jgi:hypothetical protein
VRPHRVVLLVVLLPTIGVIIVVFWLSLLVNGASWFLLYIALVAVLHFVLEGTGVVEQGRYRHRRAVHGK